MLPYPSSFNQVCDHDDDVHVLLPHHPPEGFKGVLEGPLSPDVGVALLIPVDHFEILDQCPSKIVRKQIYSVKLQSSHRQTNKP